MPTHCLLTMMDRCDFVFSVLPKKWGFCMRLLFLIKKYYFSKTGKNLILKKETDAEFDFRKKMGINPVWYSDLKSMKAGEKSEHNA